MYNSYMFSIWHPSASNLFSYFFPRELSAWVSSLADLFLSALFEAHMDSKVPLRYGNVVFLQMVLMIVVVAVTRSRVE